MAFIKQLTLPCFALTDAPSLLSSFIVTQRNSALVYLISDISQQKSNGYVGDSSLCKLMHDSHRREGTHLPGDRADTTLVSSCLLLSQKSLIKCTCICRNTEFTVPMAILEVDISFGFKEANGDIIQ